MDVCVQLVVIVRELGHEGSGKLISVLETLPSCAIFRIWGLIRVYH